MLGLALPDLLPVDVVQPWFALPLAPPPQPCFFVFAPELKTERNHINWDNKKCLKMRPTILV